MEVIYKNFNVVKSDIVSPILVKSDIVSPILVKHKHTEAMMIAYRRSGQYYDGFIIEKGKGGNNTGDITVMAIDNADIIRGDVTLRF